MKPTKLKIQKECGEWLLIYGDWQLAFNSWHAAMHKACEQLLWEFALEMLERIPSR